MLAFLCVVLKQLIPHAHLLFLSQETTFVPHTYSGTYIFGILFCLSVSIKPEWDFVAAEIQGHEQASVISALLCMSSIVLRWPNTVFQCTGVIKHYLKTT